MIQQIQQSILDAINGAGTYYCFDEYDTMLGIHQLDSGEFCLTEYQVIDVTGKVRKDQMGFNRNSVIYTIDEPTDLGCFETLSDLMEDYPNIEYGDSVPASRVKLH